MRHALSCLFSLFLIGIVTAACTTADPLAVPASATPPPLATAPLPAAAPPQEAAAVPDEAKVFAESTTVTVQRLNLRSGASSKERILGVLKQGDRLEVVRSEGNWSLVRTADGQEGWVSERFITSLTPGAAATEPAARPAAVPVQKPAPKPAAKAAETPFTDLYRRAWRAIVKGDLGTFQQLTLPPDPPQSISAEEFAEAKDMMLFIFPDPAATRTVALEKDASQAILVMQTDLDDKQNINLTAFRFKLTDNGWQLVPQVKSHSFSRHSPTQDKKAIQQALKEQAAFQLSPSVQAEAPAPPAATAEAVAAAAGNPMPEGQTAAGQLTTGKTAANFKHAVAFPRKLSGQEGETSTVVLLTEVPVPEPELLSGLKESGNWSGFQNNLKIAFDPQGQPFFLWFYLREGNLNLSTSPQNVKSTVKRDGDRIQGRIFMEKAADYFDQSYRFDVTFTASVLTIP